MNTVSFRCNRFSGQTGRAPKPIKSTVLTLLALLVGAAAQAQGTHNTELLPHAHNTEALPHAHNIELLPHAHNTEGGHGSSPPPLPPPPPPPSRQLNVKNFGAKGDGVTDDTAAINTALAAAKSAGDSLLFPAGNYPHSGLVVANGITLVGVGATSILTATSASNGAVELTGSGASVSLMKIGYASPSSVAFAFPDTEPQAGAVWINSASNFTLSQVTVSNASNNAIDVLSSSSGSVQSVAVNGASNDGILISDCAGVQILNNSVQGIGNVALAVEQTSTGSSNLTIQGNTLTSAGNASVSLPLLLLTGGIQSSQVSSNTLTATGAINPALYVNANNGSFTISNLTVSGNSIDGGSGVNHIFVGIEVASLGTSSSVTVTNNTVKNIGLDSIDVTASDNVTVSSNTITTVANVGIEDFACQNVVITGNTVSGAGVDAIFAADINGTTQISNNTMSNCCLNTGSNEAVITVNTLGGFVGTLTITNNNYEGLANNATFYVACLVPSAQVTTRTISGNIETPTLPNNIVP
jgi:Pectate lyase superfamily protein/Right handed beta helix region